MLLVLIIISYAFRGIIIYYRIDITISINHMILKPFAQIVQPRKTMTGFSIINAYIIKNRGLFDINGFV